MFLMHEVVLMDTAVRKFVSTFIIWCTRHAHVCLNVTRSTKLGGPQRSPDLTFRSTNFCLPENLFFLALVCYYHG